MIPMQMAKIPYSEMKNRYGSNNKKTADAAATNHGCRVRFSLEIFLCVTQLNLIFKDLGMNPYHKLKCS